MKNIKLFSGEMYKLKYDWNNEHIQAEDGNSVLGHGKAFIEIFYDDFYIRGDGKSIEEAEDNAWNKYSKYLDCNGKHNYERKSDSGLGCCKTCGIKTVKLPNISKCTCCNKIGAIFYIGSDLHCLTHFLEKAKQLKKISNNKHVLKKLFTIEYLFDTERVNEDSTDKEINEHVDNLIQYGEKSLFNFCSDEIDKVLCTDEPKDYDSSCDLFDELCMNKEDLYIILPELTKTRYGKRKASKKLKELFIERAKNHNLKVR